MTAICMPRYISWADFLPGTPAMSREGNREWIQGAQAARERLRWDEAPAPKPVEDRLATALLQAKQAVQDIRRHLSASEAEAITNALSHLLSIDAWEDGDEVLRVRSVRTMLRVITGLERGPGEMSLAHNGNLVSTWSLDNHVLRVEAQGAGWVAWTLLHPRGTAPRHEHEPNDTIANLRTRLDQLLGRSGGHSERR